MTSKETYIIVQNIQVYVVKTVKFSQITNPVLKTGNQPLKYIQEVTVLLLFTIGCSFELENIAYDSVINYLFSENDA